ncbi:MAG: hypothetical protein HYU77_14625 [Betaproteobacteria bacterium]|nr:hypothetical protein [Betaproteobacteria bacterium]
MAEEPMENVLKAEQEWIRKRRESAGQPAGAPAEDAVGLALSGGGVRSATFNLGVLQALERYGVLKTVDYLSTVSGGGYIGSCLTWICGYLGKPFPFGASRKDYAETGRILAWLREHGSYLTPGNGLNLWALMAAVLMGTFINLLVLVPVFLAATWGLAAPGELLHLWADNGFAALLDLGLILLAALLVYFVVYALGSRAGSIRGFASERRSSQLTGILLAAGLGCVALGSVPLAHEYLAAHLRDWVRTVLSTVSLTGLAAILGVLVSRSKDNEQRGWRAFALAAGLALLGYGLSLWAYHVMYGYVRMPEWLGWSLVLSAALALLANINHVSMHRFYRNRLMEAYLPYGLCEVPAAQADGCRLRELAAPRSASPYPLINTNMQTVGSANAKLGQRGGENFVFSPLYCGSDHTAFVPTAEYAHGDVNLATAFSISGAAVDANTFATRSRPLAFFMALLNVRLGYWILNPRHNGNRVLSRLKPLWYAYMFKEMLGAGIDETSWHVHLSDGGHFENLGLYELVRRRCRTIIVCDAGADPGWTFEDLSNAIEKLRVDFGARVEIDIAPLVPRDRESGRSPQASVRGRILYADNSQADLTYLTTTLIDGLSEDIYGYRRAHSSFPDETTQDQFFDEAQFEAYRELGFQVGRRAIPIEDRLRGEIRYQTRDRAIDPDGWTRVEQTVRDWLARLSEKRLRDDPATVDRVETKAAELGRALLGAAGASKAITRAHAEAACGAVMLDLPTA